MTRRIPAVLALLLAAMPAVCGAQEEARPGVKFIAVVPQYGLEEMIFQLPPDRMNPYDTDELACVAVIRMPSGKTQHVPAFFCETWDPVADRPLGESVWKVRYTPTEAGDHQAEIQVITRRGIPQSLAIITFAARQSLGGGFVKRSGRRLVGPDDRELFLAGADLCWGNLGATEAYFDTLRMAAENGVNCVRVWLAPWWLRLEQRPGEYDQSACARLDRIIAEAESLGLKVILCIEQHGNFEPPGLQVGLWLEHPYYRRQGGPCAVPLDFFTDAEARRLFRNRLRYIVARWGHSTSLVSWELFNEVEWIPFKGSFADHIEPILAWHTEMAEFLRACDPYGHLVSTSSDIGLQLRLAEDGRVDLIQLHLYDMEDVAARLFEVGADTTARTDVPVIMGEYGENPKECRPEAVLRGMFAAAFSGQSGALPWLQDDPVIFPCLNAVGIARRLLADITADLTQADGLTGESKEPGLRLFGFQMGSSAALYVYRDQDGKADPKPLGVQMQVKGLTPGAYSAEFFHPGDGTLIGKREITAEAGVEEGAAVLNFEWTGADLLIRLVQRSTR